ncbi:MAG: segregation/condensation protein A [Leptospira sp.]|nr:segregation/condensation protein A [Leptospira sp.]
MSETEDNPVFTVRWNNSEGGLTEGPLSLLWNLIESYQIDIFDVALSRITKDFINFIRISQSLSIELGAEFTLMAANLVYLKSKALLPDPGYEEEDQENTLPKDLVLKLLEHKKFQLAGKDLGEIEKISSGVFNRESNQILIDFPEDENWLEVSLLELISAFNTILEKNSKNNEIPDVLIAKNGFSVEEKITHLENLLKLKNEVFFFEIFEVEKPEVGEIVASFLAVLEIVKLKFAVVRQHKMFGDIKILKA